MEKSIPNTGVKITAEMMRDFKTLNCDCGGLIFETGVIFKQISPLLSPSGKEEAYPIEVFVCKACKKVPSRFNMGDILPEGVLAKKPEFDEHKIIKT